MTHAKPLSCWKKTTITFKNCGRLFGGCFDLIKRIGAVFGQLVEIVRILKDMWLFRIPSPIKAYKIAKHTKHKPGLFKKAFHAMGSTIAWALPVAKLVARSSDIDGSIAQLKTLDRAVTLLPHQVEKVHAKIGVHTERFVRLQADAPRTRGVDHQALYRLADYLGSKNEIDVDSWQKLQRKAQCSHDDLIAIDKRFGKDVHVFAKLFPKLKMSLSEAFAWMDTHTVAAAAKVTEAMKQGGSKIKNLTHDALSSLAHFFKRDGRSVEAITNLSAEHFAFVFSRQRGAIDIEARLTQLAVLASGHAP